MHFLIYDSLAIITGIVSSLYRIPYYYFAYIFFLLQHLFCIKNLSYYKCCDFRSFSRRLQIANEYSKSQPISLQRSYQTIIHQLILRH